MVIRLPRKLPRKATIGIVSPASPQRDVKRLERGIAYLEGMGHTVVCAPNALAVHGGYLAGTQDQRIADLHMMFADKRIDAIFCARGGYGSAQLLRDLDYDLIRKNPKILVGFSDITALQLALFKKTGLVTFSGAMPSVDMADEFSPISEEWFWRVLRSTRPLGKLSQPFPFEILKKGNSKGLLLGGNLTVATSLVGTPFMPTLTGNILVLEDIGEETYRIDRMLQQLVNSGVWERLGGVVFGKWTQGAPALGRSTPARDVNEVLTDFAVMCRGPVLSKFMYGHETLKFTLPMGVHCRLTARGLTVTGSAVQD